MADDNVIQPDATSKKGEALPEDAEEQTQEQPLTEERIKQIVAEATGTATEAARREIQSIKDKARSEVEVAQARAQLAEGTLAGVEGTEELDPQAVKLAKYEARDKILRQQAFVTQRQQQQTVFAQKFNDSMNQFVTSLGIDPNDKRIDWGNDAKDYWEKQERIATSVSKIQKENQKVAEEKLTQQQVDFEAKIRKDLGLDTEDTSISPGVGVDFQKLSPEEKIKAGLKEPKKKK